jgi:hypothetical protein
MKVVHTLGLNYLGFASLPYTPLILFNFMNR